MPTDTPSPLAAAAEALLRAARAINRPTGSTNGWPVISFVGWQVSDDAIIALRAALASDAAWRARAEAALRLCQAQDANAEAFDQWSALIEDDPNDTDWAKVEPKRVALDVARNELRAARDGWAAVGGREVVDG